MVKIQLRKTSFKHNSAKQSQINKRKATAFSRYTSCFWSPEGDNDSLGPLKRSTFDFSLTLKQCFPLSAWLFQIKLRCDAKLPLLSLKRPNTRSQIHIFCGYQSLVGFQTPWAVFRIRKPRIPDSASKFSPIPVSASKNFPDSGILYWHGVMLTSKLTRAMGIIRMNK